METIEVIKDTDFSEEFPIGISILDKNSIHYISEEYAKELYKKLGEVLGMSKADDTVDDKINKALKGWKEYIRGYKEGYRKAKEENQ